MEETTSGQELKGDRANRTSNGQVGLEINFLRPQPRREGICARLCPASIPRALGKHQDWPVRVAGDGAQVPAGVSQGTQATYKQHMAQHGPCQDAGQQQAWELPSEAGFVVHTQ